MLDQRPGRNNFMSEQHSTGSNGQRIRMHYLPITEVAPGMVLGDAVFLAERKVLRFSLPAGHALTEDNLRQLIAHRAEFVCIAMPDQRTDAEVSLAAANSAGQVMKIFEGADLSRPAVAALFDRILAYRSR